MYTSIKIGQRHPPASRRTIASVPMHCMANTNLTNEFFIRAGLHKLIDARVGATEPMPHVSWAVIGAGPDQDAQTEDRRPGLGEETPRIVEHLPRHLRRLRHLVRRQFKDERG